VISGVVIVVSRHLRTRDVVGGVTGFAGTLLLVAACSSGTSTPTPPTATSAVVAATTPSAAASPASSPGPTQVVTPASASALPVLAETDLKTGVPTHLTVNEFRVSGQLLQLTWTVTNTSQTDRTFTIQNTFADGISEPPSSDMRAFGLDLWSADGVYLVDSVNAKRYLVARTEDKVCVCTTGLIHTALGAGKSATLTASFKAPPDGVTTLRIVMPNTAPLDVAVQR
jgi:hypothetical protein